jgi:ABC-type multidrug transport system permease subunit
MAEQKTYDAILATPIGVPELVAGDVLWAASKSLLSGTAVLAVATVAGLVQSPWALVLPVVSLLIGIVFGAMGMVVASRAKAYDVFTYYFTLVITVMYLFGGVFFPSRACRHGRASSPDDAAHPRGGDRPRLHSRHGHLYVLPHLAVLVVMLLVAYVVAVGPSAAG